jgi:hypothetical protein
MVYVATDSDGAVKVGWSNNPMRRCRQLKATLVRVFDLPLEWEERLHKELRYLFLPVRSKQRHWQPGRVGGAPHVGEWYQPQGFVEGGVIETLSFVLEALDHLKEWFEVILEQEHLEDSIVQREL